MELFTLKESKRYFKTLNSVKERFKGLMQAEGYLYYEPSYFENYKESILVKGEANHVQLQGRNGKVVLLRSDITTQIMREIVPKLKDEEPMKLYYDTVQFKRKRDGFIEEDKQFGVEFISEDDALERQVLGKAKKLLDSLKCAYVLEVGTTDFLGELRDFLMLSEAQSSRLKTVLYAKDYSAMGQFIKQCDVSEEVEVFLREIFSLSGTACEVLTRFKRFSFSGAFKKTLKLLSELCLMDQEDEAKSLFVDCTLQSRYAYYEGLIFKGYLKNTASAVLRGGRYDLLTELYGMRKKAVGFSVSIDACVKEVMEDE